MTVPTLAAGLDFDRAAHLVLTYLTAEIPLALWSVTRVENGRQTFIYLNEDNGYGLSYGDYTPWEDSFCIHMARGDTPAVTATPMDVPQYAHAAEVNDMKVGTYAGAVIDEPDGRLFGTICGIDQHQRIDEKRLATATPLLQFMGRMLSLVLAADRYREQVADRLARATLAAETDAMTGLLNRRAWDRLLAEEDDRFRRFADPTVTAIVDLDRLKTINDVDGHAAGDDYIKAAACTLLSAVRSTDVVARLGGDEFGVLMRECTYEDAGIVVGQLQRALEASGVHASIGWASVTASAGFAAAISEADAAMYADKAIRGRSAR